MTTSSEQEDSALQSKSSQWSSGLVDDTPPEMGNWDEWEAFMASDQATKEFDPEDAADADELFTTSEVRTPFSYAALQYLPSLIWPYCYMPLHMAHCFMTVCTHMFLLGPAY